MVLVGGAAGPVASAPMAGTVVIIVLLALFPVVFLMANVVLAAIIGVFLKKDRDDAYVGTEYLVLANGPAPVDAEVDEEQS
jgi:hypothetical protein